jgi:PTH1 family peptidyl-tRNA hydrolase
MKLVVGLGNIGDKYCFNRHNAGFMAIDRIAIVNNVTFREDKKLKSYIGKYKYVDEDIMLIKPTTFMNLSGDAVQLVMNYYKIPVEDILIIYDDLSLELGKIRFRPNGSDGGHNGIKSIIKSVGTQNIPRLKIGIGPQPPIPSEQFVLQNFYKSQLEELKPVLKSCEAAVEYYFDNGMQKAQNLYN